MKAIKLASMRKAVVGGFFDPKLPRDEEERKMYDIYGAGGSILGILAGAGAGHLIQPKQLGYKVTGGLIGAAGGRALGRRLTSSLIARNRAKSGKPIDTAKESKIKGQRYADILLSDSNLIDIGK